MAATPPLGEFERIARFFAPLAAPGGLGLKDDAALIDGPAGTDYLLTADAIVEGVHFLATDPPAQVARKLLRVNLSDLAAKGAVPLGYLLTTALPPACDDAWLAAFAAGLGADQAEFGIGLLGGDSVATAGPATLSVTAIGQVAAGRALLRQGARPGDLVYVSGTLGDAAIGLTAAKGGLAGLAAAARTYLIERYRLPQPRLRLGARLIGLARAAIDISDGLVADLGHLCVASGVGAKIMIASLPLSAAAKAALTLEPRLHEAPLAGGDDYELAFAVAPEAAGAVAALAEGLPLTPIGRFVAGAGVAVLDATGSPITMTSKGYRHF